MRPPSHMPLAEMMMEGSFILLRRAEASASRMKWMLAISKGERARNMAWISGARLLGGFSNRAVAETAMGLST
ncbi:hypothetical protein D3C87_1607730 [compost metagenome]